MHLDPGGIVGETVIGDNWLWAPGMKKPWFASGGATIKLVTPDGNTVAFQKPIVGTDMGRLVGGSLFLVRVPDCIARGCHLEPIVVSEPGTPFSFELSNDGRFAIVDLWDDVERMVLFDTARATPTLLASLSSPQAFGGGVFSDDGSLVAILEYYPGGDGPNSLLVFSTGDAAPVAFAPVPEGDIGQVQFLADDSLLEIVDVQNGFEAYRVTAESAIKVASGDGHRLRLVGERYLFEPRFAWDCPPLFPPVPLVAYDITSPTRPPVTFTASVAVLLGADETLSHVAFSEYVDSTNCGGRTGTLVLASLPDGKRLATFAKIWLDQTESWLRWTSAALAEGSDALVYADNISMETLARDRSGTLHVWRDGVDNVIDERVKNFGTRSSPDTLYYTVSDGTADLVRAVPIP
jgi:hypothetical protein